MSRKTQILSQHIEDGHLVTVYAEKKTKKVRWMKGEQYCGVLQRVDDIGGSMVHFSRKPGKI